MPHFKTEKKDLLKRLTTYLKKNLSYFLFRYSESHELCVVYVILRHVMTCCCMLLALPKKYLSKDCRSFHLSGSKTGHPYGRLWSPMVLYALKNENNQVTGQVSLMAAE